MNKNYAQYDGHSLEERALERYAKLIIEKIKAIEKNELEPWFNINSKEWPRGLSGKNFNGIAAMMLLLHCEKNGYRVPAFLTFEQAMGLNTNKGVSEGDRPLAVERELFTKGVCTKGG